MIAEAHSRNFVGAIFGIQIAPGRHRRLGGVGRLAFAATERLVLVVVVSEDCSVRRKCQDFDFDTIPIFYPNFISTLLYIIGIGYRSEEILSTTAVVCTIVSHVIMLVLFPVMVLLSFGCIFSNFQNRSPNPEHP